MLIGVPNLKENGLQKRFCCLAQIKLCEVDYGGEGGGE